MPDKSLVAAHNGQESGYTRAGRKLPTAELFVGLNTGLAVGEDAGPLG